MSLTLTAGQKTVALANGGSELKFVFAREGVSEDFQAWIFHLGIKNVRPFGLFVNTLEEL